MLLLLGSLLPGLTDASFFVCIIVPSVVASEPHSEPWAGIAGLGELPLVRGSREQAGGSAPVYALISLFFDVCYLPY